MPNTKKIQTIALTLLALSVSVSLIYHFIVRPIQQDGRLDSCIDSMWALYGDQDDMYNEKVTLCVKEIKGN